jgi:hypothetical protein
MKFTYKYDDKGNEIEYNRYNSNGNLDYKYTCKYKYDNTANWIERIRYESEANIATQITERIIEYYE